MKRSLDERAFGKLRYFDTHGGPRQSEEGECM
jgi:hypothetical protein